jgi:hypothetical protein
MQDSRVVEKIKKVVLVSGDRRDDRWTGDGTGGGGIIEQFQLLCRTGRKLPLLPV